MTIDQLWAQANQDHQALPALGWVGESAWTYGEVAFRVRSLQALWGPSLTRGDRVALWAPNHPGWGVVYLAVTTGPWVVVPILPEFTPRETANVLIHSGARVLVAGRALSEVWRRWLDEASEEVRRSLADLRVEVLEDLIGAPGPGSLPEISTLGKPDVTDLAALVYTSGTTGASKGVMLTHGNLTSNVLAAAPIPGLNAGDRMLSVLPLAHTYECTIGFLIPLHKGCHISYLTKPPSPTVLLPALALVRPHAMLTVPLFMEKIYRSKVRPGLTHGLVGVLARVPGIHGILVRIAGARLKKTFGGRIKFFGIGGAPLAPEVAKFLHEAGFPVAIGYGLTETSPLVAGHLGCRLYSTGRPLDGVRVRISEPRDSQGAGEIQVKGPNVMAGYYRDPGRTSEVFTEDDWLKTGDLGVFDHKGHLHIKGRSKNVILGPSGENIYPEAIEALINQDRLVLESLVLQRGQEIVAKVVLNYELLQELFNEWGGDTGRALEGHLTDLKQQINQQLAHFSRLSLFEVQSEPFEKTATLKIKRYLYE